MTETEETVPDNQCWQCGDIGPWEDILCTICREEEDSK